MHEQAELSKPFCRPENCNHSVWSTNSMDIYQNTYAGRHCALQRQMDKCRCLRELKIYEAANLIFDEQLGGYVKLTPKSIESALRHRKMRRYF